MRQKITTETPWYEHPELPRVVQDSDLDVWVYDPGFEVYVNGFIDREGKAKGQTAKPAELELEYGPCKAMFTDFFSNRLVDLDEAAFYLQIPRAKLIVMAQEGKGPQAVHVLGMTYYFPGELAEYDTSRKNG